MTSEQVYYKVFSETVTKMNEPNLSDVIKYILIALLDKGVIDESELTVMLKKSMSSS